MTLTLKLLKLSIKKQMEYKLNFFLLCIAVFPLHIIQIFFSWIITKRFGNISGWNILEISFLYGILYVSYSFAQVLFRHFRHLDGFILNGNLDLCYTKPLSITYNLVFFNINSMELVSQLLPSVVLLFIITTKISSLNWTINKVIVLILAIIGGIIIQACLFIIIGLISFWTYKSSELIDIFFTLREFLYYPLDIYGKHIKYFFTFILPMAFINYYPCSYILNKGDKNEYVYSMLILPVSLIILAITSFLWKKALSNYSSSGS